MKDEMSSNLCFALTWQGITPPRHLIPSVSFYRPVLLCYEFVFLRWLVVCYCHFSCRPSNADAMFYRTAVLCATVMHLLFSLTWYAYFSHLPQEICKILTYIPIPYFLKFADQWIVFYEWPYIEFNKTFLFWMSEWKILSILANNYDLTFIATILQHSDVLTSYKEMKYLVMKCSKDENICNENFVEYVSKYRCMEKLVISSLVVYQTWVRMFFVVAIL